MFDFKDAPSILDLITNDIKSDNKIDLTKEDLCEQLVSELNIDATLTSSEVENTLCNYVFILNMVRLDLAEIQDRLAVLKTELNATSKKDDYKRKKIFYFTNINKNARDEITDYLNKGIIKTLLDCKSYKLTSRKDDGLNLLFLNSRYDYAFWRRYYNPDYDFSTEVKIRFLPGVKLENMLETVEKFIKQKADSPTEFAAKIDKIVSENNSISYIRDKIKSHYYLSKRSEIFDTLVDLYDNKKYLSFITMATLQLEGIFYDCLTIMNHKELGSKAGTLVEKVDKVFSQNAKIRQALYPYFAFEVPIIRNEIAHIGLTSTENLEHFCNEMILDLYCVVYWACDLSDDKYKAIALTYAELKKQDKYNEEGVFEELFGYYQICDREFIKVLCHPDLYYDELSFIKSLATDENAVTIKEMVNEIAAIINTATFWDYISNFLKEHSFTHKEGTPYDIVDFILALKNEFIRIYKNDSPEKVACIEVSKIIDKM